MNHDTHESSLSRASSFAVGGRVVCVDARHARPFAPVSSLTPVPRAPEVLLGLFAARGQVWPLYDINALLEPGAAPVKPALAATLEFQGRAFALRADRALGLPFYDAGAVKPLPSSAPMGLRRVSIGLVSVEGEDAVLLEPVRLLEFVHDLFEAKAGLQPSFAA